MPTLVPFDLPADVKPEQVLFRWSPPASARNERGGDCPTEYVVASAPEAIAGIVVYGLYPRHGWLANVSNRWLVAHLLDERKDTTEAYDRMHAQWRAAVARQRTLRDILNGDPS